MRKAQLTRDNIIRQSAELFNLKGYSGASIQDVMKKTGLQKGGIYRHFESKEQLAIEAFRFAFDQLKIKYVGAYAESDAPHIKMLKFFEKLKDKDLSIIGGCPILNTGIEADDTNEPLRVEATKALDQWKKLVKSVIDDAIKQGSFRKDIDTTKEALFIIASVEGGIFLSKLHKDKKYLTLVADMLIERVNTFLMR